MNTQTLLRIARRVYSSPCFVSHYADDDGNLVTELRSIHGGRLITVTSENEELARIAIVDVMQMHDTRIRMRTPQTSEQTIALLEASLAGGRR